MRASPALGAILMAVRPHSCVKTAGTAETTAQGFNLVVTFNTLNLSLAEQPVKVDADATSPDVGLGFGPDCHFFDTESL